MRSAIGMVGGGVPNRHREGGLELLRLDRREIDQRRPLAAPRAFRRLKLGWRRGDELVLLVGRQVNHAPGIVRVAERREDFAGDPKIGVVHMGRLGCAGKRERRFAKLVRSHRTLKGVETA